MEGASGSGRRSLSKNSVEEIPRFEGLLVQGTRILSRGLALPEATIPTGQTVITMTAVSRDPAGYSDPHRFDISCDDTHHHAFGGGAHSCLGAQLARLKAQIAQGALVRRFPKISLADAPLTWRRFPAFRAVESLRILIG